MATISSHSERPVTPNGAVRKMRRLLRENRAGKQKGIYAVCSANRFVLEAAFAQAAQDGSPLLIEATCNQVNQDGGYTGQTPTQFREYVHGIANSMGFPTGMLILGGDHLGPNPWRTELASTAMAKARAMVSAFAAAGFGKIHLDASMTCRDDSPILTKEEIATRAAQLCEAAESATPGNLAKPLYVIGTEVPTPGGAREEMEIEITTRTSLQETLDLHQRAFAHRGLSSAWNRIIGVVVQPGVEFGDETIAEYVPERASDLAKAIAQEDGIVFEAHSTDYQLLDSLRGLIRDHSGILKVGPELTFVMREAIFGLFRIEEEWIPKERHSNLRTIIEQVMVEHPEHWRSYYHGGECQVRAARAYSLSDRIRYYWPNARISDAVSRLIQNLQEYPAPLTLVAQYLPHQALAIRTSKIKNEPTAIIRHRIKESLARYSEACGLAIHK